MSHFWGGSKFCFMIFVLALTLIVLLVSQYTSFNVIPFPKLEAKAINHAIYHAASLTKQCGDNTGLSSSSSTASGTTSSCISHLVFLMIRQLEQLRSAAVQQDS
jgi:hypothetical protein